jgi:hypothetical protein
LKQHTWKSSKLTIRRLLLSRRLFVFEFNELYHAIAAVDVVRAYRRVSFVQRTSVIETEDDSPSAEVGATSIGWFKCGAERDEYRLFCGSLSGVFYDVDLFGNVVVRNHKTFAHERVAL